MLAPHVTRWPAGRCPAVLLLCAVLACGTPARLNDGIAEVRDLYFARDFPTAFARAQELAAAYPRSTRVRAWQFAAAAESRRTDLAISGAEDLTHSAPDDPWSWFALALVLRSQRTRADEALAASERALGMLPSDPDIIWMRAQTLTSLGAPADAVVVIDSLLTPSAEQLNAKAQALVSMTYGPDADPARFDEALETYRRAREVDPGNVNAHYLPADRLRRARRNDEAMPLLEEALRIVPDSAEVRALHWYTILGLAALSPEDKRRRIDAGVAALLEARPDDARALFAVEEIYSDLGEPELKRQYEERILSQFPDRPEAESVLIGRFRALSREVAAEGAGEQRHADYRAALRAFIDLPERHRAVFLGEAYMNLFYELSRDPAADPAELHEAIRGMVEHETLNPHVTFGMGAAVLAERVGAYREAEAMARRGLEAARVQTESMRPVYRTEGDYENSLNFALAVMHDALGQVFFFEGRHDDARAALLKAHELNPRDRDNLHHLGRLAEATGDVAGAEGYYVQGLAAQRPGDNPNRAALEALYRARSGDLAGFDDYIADLERAESAARRAEVLEGRMANPEPAADFALMDLEGRQRTLADLAGKVAVINFWGIWCGWCVIEMADLQTLHERYAENPEVVILTINNDSNPDEVPPWMQEKGYSLPVLLDDGYVRAAGVTGFPTTWFLDRDGRIAFEKKGWSQELIEEFTWRIDAVLEGAP